MSGSSLPPGLEDVFQPEADEHLAVLADETRSPAERRQAARALADAAGLVGAVELQGAAEAILGALDDGTPASLGTALENARLARLALAETAPDATDSLGEPNPHGFDEPELAELRAFFLDEAEEHVRAMTHTLARLEELKARHGGPPSGELVEQVASLFRSVHSLKGSAATVGLPEVSQAAHAIEERFAELRDGRLPLGALDVDAMTAAIDALRDLCHSQSPPDSSGQAPPDKAPDKAPERTDANPVETTPRQATAAPAALGADGTTGSRPAIRVDVARIDNLMSVASELLFDRTRIERRLQEVRELVRDLGERRRSMRAALPSLLGSPGAGSGTSDVDATLERLGEIEADLAAVGAGLERATVGLLGDMQELRRTSTELQAGLARIRTTPMTWVFARLERPAREAARSESKKVRLELRGADTEIDRALAEGVADPLVQLVRNAVVHGIEPPAQRRAAGKPEAGTLEVGALHDGDSVLLWVTDDGAGLDPERIKAALVESGRVREGDAERLTDADLQSLIFLPGLSTRAGQADQLAGRGVGLDVAREAIARLGGDLSVTSTRGTGTRFAIRLPLTTAITSAVLVKAAGQVYAFPHATVVETTQVDWTHARTCTGESWVGSVEHRGQWLPALRLGELLGGEPSVDPRSPGVVVRHGERRFVVTCDRLIGSRDIVVRGLGPLLAPIGLYAGATLSGAGKVQLILDVGALAALTFGHPAIEELAPPGEEGAPVAQEVAPEETSPVRRPRVLLADDSRTVRETAARILTAGGYRVDTVTDGWEASQRLLERRYDLLVTDLDMPRVDGFELIARVRRSETLRDLPILVLSSRTGDESRRRAEQAGATSFIGKPLSRPLILERVKGLLPRR
jgi:chemosensory pili system protein ChpA (sensor histidine kinase/response regulator)